MCGQAMVRVGLQKLCSIDGDGMRLETSIWELGLDSKPAAALPSIRPTPHQGTLATVQLERQGTFKPELPPQHFTSTTRNQLAPPTT